MNLGSRTAISSVVAALATTGLATTGLVGTHPATPTAEHAARPVAAKAAAQATLPGSSCPVFPADNVWNTAIDKLPVAASSASWVSSIGASTGLHPDFGAYSTDHYGIPYNVVSSSHPTQNLSFDYADESDPNPYLTGSDLKVEGTPGDGGDDHQLTVNSGTCQLQEIYQAQAVNHTYTAGSGAKWSLTSNALRPDGWTSSDAAGLPVLPGLVRAEEVKAGAINHALRFTASSSAARHLWPARHHAGSGTTKPPMGARFRLKANVDISGFGPQSRVIMTAMKKYGMFLADNGSNWYFSGTSDDAWNPYMDQLVSDFRQLKGSDFEAVDESSLMVSPNSGQARQPASAAGPR